MIDRKRLLEAEAAAKQKEGKENKAPENLIKFDYENGLFWVSSTYKYLHLNKHIDQKCIWKVVKYNRDQQHNVRIGYLSGSAHQGRRCLQDGKDGYQSQGTCNF